MVALRHVANLLEGNGKSHDTDAETAIQELEQLVEATGKAQREGTLDKNCNNDESSTLPRVQEEATKQTPDDYEYTDPARPITRSMSQHIFLKIRQSR